MDTDRLNRWQTLGASIGVLAGLIFLVAEIRQNSEIKRGQPGRLGRERRPLSSNDLEMTRSLEQKS